MKRLYQFLSTLTLSLMLATVGASAATTDTSACNIFNTGTDSFNKCETNVKNNVTISCTNDIYVVNDNNQSSTTGPALVTDNSTSGSATSGNSTNNNGSAAEIGASCQKITTAAATSSVAPAAVPAAQQAKPSAAPTQTSPAVSSLPETGSNAATKDAAYAGIALVSLVAISQLGLIAYKKLV